MSDETDKESQTEAPTQKKLDDARKRGQVASSAEVKHGAVFGAAALGMGLLGAASLHLKAMLAGIIEGAGTASMDGGSLQNFMWGLFGHLAIVLLPVFGLMFGAGLVGGLLQGRPTISWSRVAPQFSKLNPLKGVKRVFAPVEFLKTLAKFAIVTVAVVWVVWPSAWALEGSLLAGPEGLISMASDILFKLLLTIATLAVLLALADRVYQQIAFMRRMRMTKQQVKEEYKDNEGDPHIKGRIRQIQQERSRMRMMAEVPNATVVITNPTHYAVALAYDHGKSNAPRVVAKGVDAMAARIREVATANDVPLFPKPELARALYASVKIDQEVPEEFFVPVAEVINFVMKLKSSPKAF